MMLRQVGDEDAKEDESRHAVSAVGVVCKAGFEMEN